MLKDRLVLVEEDIVKLKTRCSKLYGQIAFSGDHFAQEHIKRLEYDNVLQELQTRLTEKMLIDEMIANGHP
jgi:hypothetical protein